MHTPPASGSKSNSQWAAPGNRFQSHVKPELSTPTSSIKSAALSSSAPTTIAFASPQAPGIRTGCRHSQNLPSPSPSPSPAHANSSTQKEPGSDQYISRLLRLAQYDPYRAQRPNTGFAMADFLASLGFGGTQTTAASTNSECDSIEQLQNRLKSILDAKTTPTRAEHVATTIELRATVRFQLAVSGSENGIHESSNSPDPSIGGAQSAGENNGQDAGQLSRVVYANETLMNQPQDNPSLQRSVAKHIISVISSTDGSTWAVRKVSRGTQGWSFTYLCKDSFQYWSRQNAKNPTKTIVGEFSQREPDPILHCKPKQPDRIHFR